MTSKKETKTAVVVIFNNGSVYTFGCLAAIFDLFSAQYVGCDLRTLYCKKLSETQPFITDNCKIYKTQIMHKRQRMRTFARK